MGKKAKYRADRIVATYGHLRSASWSTFELAKSSEKGRFYNIMIAMLFCAFTLEAYLNHVGSTKIISWHVLKRKLSAREKLDFLSEQIEFDVDFGKRPFQTFIDIFRLRDTLVHAETERVIEEGERIFEDGERMPRPLSDWEKMITLKVGQRFLDDTKQIIKKINSEAGLDEDSLFSPEQIEVSIDYRGDSW